MTFARTISLAAVVLSLAGAAFGINAAADSTTSAKAGRAAESCGKCAACCQAAKCEDVAEAKAAKPCCEDATAKSTECAECAAEKGKTAKPGECAECAAEAAAKAKPEECPECAAKQAVGAKSGECAECAAESAAKTEKPAADASAEAVPHGPGFMRGRGPGFGRGRGFGPGGRFGFGRGAGAGHDDQFATDHDVFFYLLDNRKEIRRKVTNLPDGIETLTESDNPEVAAKIQEHVAAMYERVENQQPIHMRDPLFREIFANAKKIKMEMKETEHGILVKETSEDPYVAKLLHEHGKVVSLFLKNGHAELPRNHEVPAREAAATEK
jgi:hypothetical protein